ncbi:MAG: right-handed parallel beta-helix repeat-containing protein [Candidatus Thermoplasmatota archaeon]|nr:right-handed parallel beta-helix repeat-containing protein [Candidatus Thermoplasmatota archaeon]MBU1941593.1 right-handed parallel beta-helix repeat-containing protein [Candidatus Thermoplasmatota archaeon]
MKTRPIKWFALLGYLLFLGVTVAPSITANIFEEFQNNSSFYLPHRPIFIEGNNNFTRANGITSGGGTENNPYILEGWIIKSNILNPAIYIQNVNVYFVIRNCYLYNQFKKGNGLVFSNVENGIIENTTITGHNTGILFSSPDEIYGSSHNIIKNNRITHNSDGIYFAHTISYYHSDNIITHNDISDNNAGIYMIMSQNNQILYNNITSNKGIGLFLSMCMGGGQLNEVHHNNFIDNGEPALEYGDQINFWDNGYPSGGNYWIDYTGEDLFSGPQQNISGSDGIGDIPYMIPVIEGKENYDNYPLMEPEDIDIKIYTYHPSLWWQQWFQSHFPLLARILNNIR